MNAVAIPGAKIYFYITGTNTTTPIYADEALTVELANPLESDAAGRWPSIYLDDTVAYRVRITDSEDNTIPGHDVDPYLFSITEPLQSDIQSIADAAASSAGAAAASATTAGNKALLAEAWAEGTEPGGPGTKSAKEWADEAAINAQGKSAYEVAVDEGFIGTEQDWLDSLVGPQGPVGPPGADGNGAGTVTSVGISVPTGFSVANSPVTSNGTIAISFSAGYALPTTAKQSEWDSAFSQRLRWDGSSADLVASTGRTSLGATTVGSNIFTLANPSAIRYLRINADNTVTARTAAEMRGDLGAAASGANTDITALDQDITITATGTIAANTLGYRGLPQETKSSAYTLALADAGKHISITTGGITIPANSSVAFPVGTTIVIYNNSASSQNIAITTDTLRQAGTSNTGTRSLALYGLATLVKVASTTWVISGAGVS
jgi:hypothetical protein